MAEMGRIQGLFSGVAEDSALPRATEDGSGLRVRPRRGPAESLIDMSDEAVELPDEDDCLDDLRKSDTIPPGRFSAEEVAARAAALAGPPRSEPPPLPVPLSRRSAPALPLPLTRKSAPSLAELGAAVRHAPAPEYDRIDLEEIARLARSVAPVGADDEIPYAPGVPSWSPASRADRGRARRAIGVACAGLAIAGTAWVVAQLAGPAQLQSEIAPSPSVAIDAPMPVAEPVLILDAPAPSREPTQLATVVVHAARASDVPAARVVASPVEPGASRAGAPQASATNGAAPATVLGARDGEASELGAADAPTALAEAATTEPSLPETPTREDVLRAIQGVEAGVRECAAGHYGVVPIRIRVASSGRVTTAQVTGGTVVGTPAGSCIARTVRGARFPSFQQELFVVDYPFAL